MSDRSDYIRCVSGPLEAKLSKRIAELEAKLATAVGALDYYAEAEGFQLIARQALASIQERT